MPFSHISAVVEDRTAENLRVRWRLKRRFYMYKLRVETCRVSRIFFDIHLEQYLSIALMKWYLTEDLNEVVIEIQREDSYL